MSATKPLPDAAPEADTGASQAGSGMTGAGTGGGSTGGGLGGKSTGGPVGVGNMGGGGGIGGDEGLGRASDATRNRELQTSESGSGLGLCRKRPPRRTTR